LIIRLEIYASNVDFAQDHVWLHILRICLCFDFWIEIEMTSPSVTIKVSCMLATLSMRATRLIAMVLIFPHLVLVIKIVGMRLSRLSICFNIVYDSLLVVISGSIFVSIVLEIVSLFHCLDWSKFDYCIRYYYSFLNY